MWRLLVEIPKNNLNTGQVAGSGDAEVDVRHGLWDGGFEDNHRLFPRLILTIQQRRPAFMVHSGRCLLNRTPKRKQWRKIPKFWNWQNLPSKKSSIRKSSIKKIFHWKKNFMKKSSIMVGKNQKSCWKLSTLKKWFFFLEKFNGFWRNLP